MATPPPTDHCKSVPGAGRSDKVLGRWGVNHVNDAGRDMWNFLATLELRVLGFPLEYSKHSIPDRAIEIFRRF